MEKPRFCLIVFFSLLKRRLALVSIFNMFYTGELPSKNKEEKGSCFAFRIIYQHVSVSNRLECVQIVQEVGWKEKHNVSVVLRFALPPNPQFPYDCHT